MKKSILSLAGLAFVLATSVSAQTGTDTCTTPTPISGAGTFPFSNVGATTGTQGQAEALCAIEYSNPIIRNDVWFAWTAPSNGYVTLTTCALTTVDTKIAVYNGNTCPAAPSLDCNDDTCFAFYESQVQFACVNGNSYVIQIGNSSFSAPTGTGSFSISIGAPPPPPPPEDDCSTPVVISGPGLYPVDNRYATTGTQGQGNFGFCDYQTSSPALLRDVWYTYTATTNGTATVSTCGLIPSPPSPGTDSKIAIYTGAGCPSAISIACNDDSGDAGPACPSPNAFNSTVDFPVTCGSTYTIQIGMYAYSGLTILGQFSVAETGSACATPFTTSCYGDGSGTACPCSNAGIAGRGCGNGSFASGAELSCTGVASISADTLVLKGLNGSAFGAGLYFQGSANNSPAGAAFGHGIVCMSGSTPRLEIVNPQDVNGASQTAGIIHNEGGISSPGTYHYQWWYRDAVTVGSCSAAGSAFNFSNAITLTWAP